MFMNDVPWNESLFMFEKQRISWSFRKSDWYWRPGHSAIGFEGDTKDGEGWTNSLRQLRTGQWRRPCFCSANDDPARFYKSDDHPKAIICMVFANQQSCHQHIHATSIIARERARSKGQIMPARPTLSSMWSSFTTIYGDGTVAAVGKTIGGKVGSNIALGAADPKAGFTNACAIRMSYSLNRSGFPVHRGPWATVSGGDGRLYLYRVRDLLKYLQTTFGKPDEIVKNPKPEDFSGKKGILVFDVQWSDATGHATLWDGATCSDHCYFPVASEASLWQLK